MAFGTHFTDAYAGRVFSLTTGTGATGAAIPIFSATTITGGMPLWNPPNSNRAVEIVSLDINWAAGTAAIAALGLMAMYATAVNAATGSPLLTLTPLAVTNGYILGGNASKITNGGGGCTLTGTGVITPPTAAGVVPGWIRTLSSINLEASTATPLGTQAPGPTYTFNGTLVLPPGILLYVASGVASGATYHLTWVWKEIPIVAGQG